MKKKLFTRQKGFVRRPQLVVGAVAAIFIGLYGLFAIAEGDMAPESVVAGEAYAIDGDTLRIGGTTKVRLSGLAAPERNEAGGAAATGFMQQKLNGRHVSCDLSGERSYDRLIGICYLDGVDVAELLISAGLARDCPRYSGGRYAAFEPAEAGSLPFPDYCRPR